MLSREHQLLALAVVGLAGPGYVLMQVQDQQVFRSVLVSACVSLAGFAATRWLIPVVASKTLARGICGKDLNKKASDAHSTRARTRSPESALPHAHTHPLDREICTADGQGRQQDGRLPARAAVVSG